jgi:putative transposase
MIGTIRRVTRNVERWRDAGMALRWVAAGMIEANKGLPTIECA